MAEMNQAELEGRLTRDPILHHTRKSGTSVMTFALANDSVWYDHDDNKHTHTDFPIVTVWGKPAETIYKYAGKGSLISVCGRNTTRSYTNKKNERVYVQEINVGRKGTMELLNTKAPHHDNDNQKSTDSSGSSDAASDASEIIDSSSSSAASSSASASATSSNSNLPSSSSSSSSNNDNVPDDKELDKHVNDIGLNDDDLPF